MTRDEIISTTIRFLADEFEIEESEILSENNMHKTLDLDSLDYVDLVVVIEENLGFKPTADDFRAITTFNDFYNLAEQRIAAMA